MSVAGVAISAIILVRARRGEVTERMPIADAIADAATLRLIVPERFVSLDYCALCVIRRMRARAYSGAIFARDLASMAFRAVPELRS